ncbi:MAG TPA: triose-phosphate isomerase [Candidatus Bathyarchaeia archaeon]|nr:triose-phosphate isomerase [Candidatus Bathyarchaeia archaeon]
MKQIRGSLLVVNFKAYLEATGKRALDLAKAAEHVANQTGVGVIVAPQFADLKSVAENVDIRVFSQHLDPILPGAFTGHVLAESLKSAGVEGSLINHSERRVGKDQIQAAVKICSNADLYLLACADTAGAAAQIATLNPDMIAIEPPDLIGTGISVSKAKPELITESLRRVRSENKTVKVLCGAGVTDADDVSRAIELGTEGVLVASSVVKSKDPARVLMEMAKAIADSGTKV